MLRVYSLAVISSWFGPLQVIVFGGCALSLAFISAGLMGTVKDDDEEKEKERENDGDESINRENGTSKLMI